MAWPVKFAVSSDIIGVNLSSQLQAACYFFVRMFSYGHMWCSFSQLANTFVSTHVKDVTCYASTASGIMYQISTVKGWLPSNVWNWLLTDFLHLKKHIIVCELFSYFGGKPLFKYLLADLDKARDCSTNTAMIHYLFKWVSNPHP